MAENLKQMQNFAALGVNLSRGKYGPLDVSSVFYSLETLKWYLTFSTEAPSGNASLTRPTEVGSDFVPRPYEGQIIAVEVEGKVKVYVLGPQLAAAKSDGTWFNYEEVGSTAELNALSQQVVALEGQVGQNEAAIGKLQTEKISKTTGDQHILLADGTKATQTIATSITNVDTTVPTSKAVKTYVDATVGGAVQYLGTVDALTKLSTSAGKGDFYRLSADVAGYHAGDMVIAEKNNPAQLIDGINWSIIHGEAVGVEAIKAGTGITLDDNTTQPTISVNMDAIQIKSSQVNNLDNVIDVINNSISKIVTGTAGDSEDLGLISKTEKTKLANIEEGANKTIIDTDLSTTSTNPVQNKAVKGAIDNLQTAIDSCVTTSSLETTLQNYAKNTDLSTKVDKEEGKGLSTNDYTTDEKTKLAGIATGATKVSASTTNGYIKIGSTDTKVYTLPTASTTVLGGIKIGERLIIDETTGKLNGPTLASLGGMASTDVDAKITTAIGLLAIDGVTVDGSKTIASISQTNGKIAVTTQDISITSAQVAGLDNFMGTTEAELASLKKIKVTNNSVTDGTNTFTKFQLDAATKSALGGIKIGYDGTTEKTYAVKLDTNNKAYVEVPWSDTKYTLPIATDATLGGVKVDSVEPTPELLIPTTTPNRDYAVKADEEGVLWVTIPWTDTKYALPIATTSVLGGVKSTKTGTTAGKNYSVEVNTDGTMKVNVPWTDTNTFRTIQIDTAQTDPAAPLNLKSGTNISLALDHGVDSENVTINHTGPGSASQTTTETKADSSLVEDGGTVAFGKEFYVPSFGIDANGHTRDLKMTKYSLPTPETYSLQIATTTILGGIKSGNKANNFVAGSAGEGQTGNVPNYEAEVVVNSTTGKATVNLEAMAGSETQWSIVEGQTVFGIREVSTDKLVQGTNTLIINGGGAAW